MKKWYSNNKTYFNISVVQTKTTLFEKEATTTKYSNYWQSNS